jgi:hypothetical protein
MGGKINQPRVRYVFMSSFEIGIHLQTDMRPVIKTGALEQLVRNAKTEWLDKKERRMGSRAGSCYVPGVLGYFRLVEQDCELMVNIDTHKEKVAPNPDKLQPEMT